MAKKTEEKAKAKRTSKELTKEVSEEVAESVTPPPSEEEVQGAEEAPKSKKEKKVVYLKQWLVSGKAENGKEVADFYLATCGMKAREAYAKRNGEKSIVYMVMQTAESRHEASWLNDHDAYQWTMKK